MAVKFRKKPVEIEAMRLLDRSVDKVMEWIWEGDGKVSRSLHGCITIDTPEGVMTASPGDWVIKDVNGEFYPCKDEIFQKTYEVA